MAWGGRGGERGGYFLKREREREREEERERERESVARIIIAISACVG